MNSKQSEEFERAAQAAGSLSSFPSLLNTIGNATGNSLYKDAAAATTLVLMSKNIWSPGETGLENISKGVENIQAIGDIGGRIEKREEEARAARKDDSVSAFQSRATAQCTDAIETKSDPPDVGAPTANEIIERPEEDSAESPEESATPPAASPSGSEDKYDQPDIPVYTRTP
ncbi:hypothetical protein [Paraburkholderia graminis]|uniref:hypothetical protein n=1 Tax=Paraburkholderia graminis TaxID=60548 RepID=UPI0038BB3154